MTRARAGRVPRFRERLRTCVARGVLLLSPLLLAGCATSPVVETVRGTPPINRGLVADVDPALFTEGRFVARGGTVLPYRLLKPARIEPGVRYPLVLQLHSSGGIGTDNRSQLDALTKAWALPANRTRYPAFVLAPQFPVRSAHYDDPVNPRSAIASPALEAAMQLLDEVAAREPIDSDRLYATGFSMGGSAAWLSPVLRPDRFAAIAPISGIAPANTAADALRNVPILAMHGDADTENPIDADRRLIAYLGALGHRSLHLREYSGLAHAPPGDALPGTFWRDWLFAQRRVPPSP